MFTISKAIFFSCIAAIQLQIIFADSFSCVMHVNNFGDIINVQPQLTPKKSFLETVIIYPQDVEGSPNQIARNGFLLRYPDAQATVLICHGFMCDKDDVSMLRKIFKPGKYNVMTFDFRAHGQNRQGQICTFGKNEALDVIAAAKFLRAHPELKNKPLFVYGFSMGASASIQAQAKDMSLFDGMVLDCPFDSTESILKRELQKITFNFLGYEFNLPGKQILEKYAFHPYVQGLIKNMLHSVNKLSSKNIEIEILPINPAISAKKITVPCFFIHCRNDEKISVQEVKNIYSNVQAFKRLWITGGRNHFDSYLYHPELYTYQVRTFLDSILADSITTMLKQKIIDDASESVYQLFE